MGVFKFFRFGNLRSHVSEQSIGANHHEVATENLSALNAANDMTNGIASGSDNPTALLEKTNRSFSATNIMPCRILIIAEMSIPACLYYRVLNKIEALSHLGHEVEAISWWEIERCRDALQLADSVIFYRVGLRSETELLFSEAARLEVCSFFEVDDLIFDEEAFSQTSGFKTSSSEGQVQLLKGVEAYRSALLSCNHSIASTTTLAAEMAKISAGSCLVVENGINQAMHELGERNFGAALPRSQAKIVIGYGSGTSTHDADFLEAADALLMVLSRYDYVELAIHGPLLLPPEFDVFSNRIIRAPLMGMDDYLQALAMWDINIACLQNIPLNMAKSPIKFIEASLMVTPSVCSAIEPFLEIIDHGVNGFLASSTGDWLTSLTTLIESAEIRKEVGERAYLESIARFDINKRARDVLGPLIELIPQSTSDKSRIVIVGADDGRHEESLEGLVIPQLLDHDRFELITFDSTTMSGLPENALFTSRGHNHTRIKVAQCTDSFSPEKYWNAGIAAQFDRVLQAYRPHLVLILDVAKLGSTLVAKCKERAVPYAIVLQSDWWLFDSKNNGHDPVGERLPNDLRRQAAASDNPELAYHRYFELRAALQNAHLLVASDADTRQLYLDQGFSENDICCASLKDLRSKLEEALNRLPRPP